MRASISIDVMLYTYVSDATVKVGHVVVSKLSEGYYSKKLQSK